MEYKNEMILNCFENIVLFWNVQFLMWKYNGKQCHNFGNTPVEVMFEYQLEKSSNLDTDLNTIFISFYFKIKSSWK